ncbi:MmcQ/YjbR family DNA-binding protein [Asanoa sp. NPDC049518]|uniref:MmcQ/YjbR family DNA-binding protein n=1 Tax=unclassified Asanoa TaxID=2685164 RepID=UPI003439318B
MVTLDDVAQLAARLPETTVAQRRGNRAWSVAGKVFAWERAFSKADLKRYGDEPVPEGPIVATVVGDLAEKDAVLAAGTPGIFTIPHFDGYAAVLIQLSEVDRVALEAALVDAWLAKAPSRLTQAYLAG